MITPNIIAWVAVAAWPLVVWQLYTRLDRARALIWTILGAYLALPPLTKFDFPVIPDLDKDTLPGLSALVISVLILHDRLKILPESRIAQGLVLLFIVSPFATVLTNTDAIPILDGPWVPGMSIYDSAAAVANAGLFILPMFLARRDLATPEAMREILKALVLGGLIYSLPMFFEARLSPQLNNWVYGYYQHDFNQQIRFGGYRPMVFLPHGLWVAFFAFMCCVAAARLLRDGPAEERPKQMAAFLWLGVMIVICKSFGPAAYAMATLPLILLAPPRLQVWVAGVVAVVVMVYPLLRGAHVVPVWDLVEFVKGINAERAWSLEFRTLNEELLLDRAAQRPLFGWGGYGRNFIHDAVTGRMLTVADGHWVIRIGAWGWLGYIAEFGLLTLPLILLAREAMVRGAVIGPHAACVALLLALNLVDLLPNATLVPLSWLMAGALLGHAEALRRARRDRVKAARDAELASMVGRTVI